MFNLRSVLTLAAMSCALVAPAAARADVFSNTFDVHASSLGSGIGLSHAVAPNLDVRVATGSLSFNRNGTDSDLNYNGSVRLRNTAALVDFYPSRTPFRLTAGYVLGSDEIDVTGTPASGSFTINGTTYSSSQINAVTGTARLSPGAYVGIGLGASRRARVSLTADAGVVFRSVSTSLTGYGPAAGTAQFQSDLAQAQADFQNSVGALRTYPVISLGVATRF